MQRSIPLPLLGYFYITKRYSNAFCDLAVRNLLFPSLSVAKFNKTDIIKVPHQNQVGSHTVMILASQVKLFSLQCYYKLITCQISHLAKEVQGKCQQPTPETHTQYVLLLEAGKYLLFMSYLALNLLFIYNNHTTGLLLIKQNIKITNILN